MYDPHFNSVDQIEKFLKTSRNLAFGVASKKEKYLWISKVLIRFSYKRLRKKHKTIIKRYVKKITDYSMSQIKRLVRRHYQGCLNYPIKIQRRVSARKYAPVDIALLIKTDIVHDGLSGPATKKILKREYENWGKENYATISAISVSHIYNLRKTNQYKSNTSFFHKTNPVNINIGERRKPEPNGKPGYLRVDTVHQGDKIGLNEEDEQKGVYHINTVCEITQWQIIGCAEKISERYLIPVLLEILEQYPFKVLGFHADNGSEYVNRVVAALLNKLLIQLTKTRPRHSNDNALAETKNGSVIRKHFGYIHIPQPNAKLINQFYKKSFNIYLNFHRPCGFATIKTDKKGKQRRFYRHEDYETPYERLTKLPNAKQYLKDGVAFETLNKIARAKSDNEFAEEMMRAKRELYSKIRFDIKNRY